MSPPRFEDHERQVHTILGAALAACEPGRCVRDSVARDPVMVPNPAVIAVGKAAPAMYRGFVEACGEPTARFMLTVEQPGVPGWARTGDHPTPTPRNVGHADALAGFMGDPAHRSFLVLLSGGASALLCSPGPGISVGALADLSRRLMLAGADIRELNTVRTHVETLKGGGAALLAGTRPVELLVMSDVIGDDPEVIGSGPWSSCSSRPADALAVLACRGINATPEVLRVLQDTEFDERHRLREKARVPGRIVGRNATAVLAAQESARGLGFRSGVGLDLDGGAASLGATVVRGALDRGPGCWVSGGESTVSVGGGTGRGGRNQELALAAAIEIDGREGIAVATFATDGIDGPTDAAGAIVTGGTCERARRMGLDPAAFLARHDSYAFFTRVGGHLRPGPTGTNVCDLAVVLLY
ncbi:MAG: DUF4147 domain-containing protein [Phycisphaerales bacterium]|nr:DUF4147 domain-containing protein [Phycisphaerales bacterium]